MTSISKTVDKDLISQYESLRSYVLDGNPSGNRFGLSVMLQEGMISWMNLACQSGQPSSPPPARQSESMPENGYSAIVNVLANMTYVSLKEDGVL